MKLISIGKVAEILGVSPKTIREWEKNKKIEPYYTPNGHRRYNEEDIKNLLVKK